MDKWIAIRLLQNNRQFIADFIAFSKYQFREPSFANIENASPNISLLQKKTWNVKNCETEYLNQKIK